MYVSASRSFQEARERLSRVKSARGYFPVVGIGAFNGKPWYSRSLARTTDLTTRVSSTDSACCVAKLGIMHQNVPAKVQRLHFHLASVHLVHTFWAVLCSMPSVMVQRSKKTEKDQDENEIEDFVAFTIKSYGGFATLDGGDTKSVSEFMSVQPVADQFEDTTNETTDWRRNGSGKHEHLDTSR